MATQCPHVKFVVSAGVLRLFGYLFAGLEKQIECNEIAATILVAIPFIQLPSTATEISC